MKKSSLFKIVASLGIPLLAGLVASSCTKTKECPEHNLTLQSGPFYSVLSKYNPNENTTTSYVNDYRFFNSRGKILGVVKSDRNGKRVSEEDIVLPSYLMGEYGLGLIGTTNTDGTPLTILTEMYRDADGTFKSNPYAFALEQAYANAKLEWDAAVANEERPSH